MTMEPRDKKELRDASVLALSFVGDAAHTMFVRERVFRESPYKNDELHKLASAYCRASAQADKAKELEPMLREDELFIFKKGKGAHVNNVPKNATPYEYSLATALEAVVGYLFLAGENDRLEELLNALYPAE